MATPEAVGRCNLMPLTTDWRVSRDRLVGKQGGSVVAVMEQTELQVRQDGRWLAVAVIDSRRYPDQQSYERAVDEAFATMNGGGTPAQFESSQVSPTEPPSPLPSWEDYRLTLRPKESPGR
jgi:hypothetical protein